MKKLLFTFAAAAAFAAMADDPSKGANDIDVLGFENFNLSQTATVSGAVVNRGDDGTLGLTQWVCNGDDASLVKTYGGDNATAPSLALYPAPFTDGGDNYLALDTNGSELQRYFSTDTTNGTPTAVSGPLYIDTLVQFTPSESAPTSADLDGAKLAIWLGVVNNVTNLYVQGMQYSDAEISVSAPVAYKITNVIPQPGTWYRLTVKAIPAALSTMGMVSAFTVAIDGTEAVAEQCLLVGDAMDVATGGVGSILTADDLALINANKVFGSMADLTQTGLSCVGLKGTGAIDYFVVTTEEPTLAPPAIDFTLTWPSGYTAVSYQIGDAAAVAIDGNTTFPIQVPDGATVAFTFQNADGVTKTMTATASSSVNSIDASDATFTWADYLGDAVNGAYEIDNLAELKLFQKGIAITTNELKLATAGETFKLTADIALDEAWPGIGVQNGKDIYSTADFNAAAFCGTFDGQNHTISGFQMIGKGDKAEGLDYCGFFNSTYGATIQNLKIAYAGSLFAADTTASTKESGATFVGVAKNSTLDNLTTVAGTVSCSKGFGGIVGYLTSGTTVQNCTNNLNMTSLAGNKCGGIAMIAQGGSAVTISNCQNNGTQTTGSSNSEYGAIVGYVGLDVTIADCETTVGRFLKHQGNTVTLQGVNKGDPTVPAYHGAATPGLNFATVDGSTATFVADTALAVGNIYKVLGPSATATYEFAAAGSISFDTNLIQTVTFAITAPGLDLTEATESGVVTFTAAAAANYKVVIGGSDVAITPTAEDLAAFEAQGYTTPEAINAALDTVITNGVKVWEALFLGLPPTEAGLESFKIESISVAADGKVTVTLPNGVSPKTGRGVDITIKLMGSDDLSTWSFIENASGTTFGAVTPASGETKKFYKVVVEYAPSQN